MKRAAVWVGVIVVALGGTAFAQETESPGKPAAETAPQSDATTTVKQPAGVTSTTGSGQNAATGTAGQTDCKSASAEMTNGATVSCKK